MRPLMVSQFSRFLTWLLLRVYTNGLILIMANRGRGLGQFWIGLARAPAAPCFFCEYQRTARPGLRDFGL